MLPVTFSTVRRPNRRARFLRSLRKIHGWLGLWGAAMGLFFGATGILLNHRAILPLPIEKFEDSTIQFALDKPAESPQQIAALLAARLGLQGKDPAIKTEPAGDIIWNGRTVRRPEQWTITLTGPQKQATASYWRGDRTIEIKRLDANLLGTLTRFHRAVGVGVVWILVMDTIAGSLIALSITGLLLWSQMRPWRLASIGVTLGAATIAGVSAIGAL